MLYPVFRYVHKTHYGFYTWPEKMEVYAPEEEQPSLDRSCASLSAEEKVLYNFFSNQSNVDKLIGFLSLEERKGKDKFDARRFSMFKGRSQKLKKKKKMKFCLKIVLILCYRSVSQFRRRVFGTFPAASRALSV